MAKDERSISPTAVIIMTSNVGSAHIKQMGTHIDRATQRKAILSELDRHFRPEFLNRLDETIIFHSLTREHIVRIVDLQLHRLRQILLDRRISIELSEAAKMLLAETGWDPVFGARPLKRAIQRGLQDPLAMAIIEGTVGEGDHVWADVSQAGTQLMFQSKELEPAGM